MLVCGGEEDVREELGRGGGGWVEEEEEGRGRLGIREELEVGKSRSQFLKRARLQASMSRCAFERKGGGPGKGAAG